MFLLLICFYELHSTTNKAKVVVLSEKELLTDVSKYTWEYYDISLEDDSSFGMYHVRTDTADVSKGYAAVSSQKKWKSIRVGKRWEELGYPQLNNKRVWLRLKFFVPDKIKGRKLGFFVRLWMMMLMCF